MEKQIFIINVCYLSLRLYSIDREEEVKEKEKEEEKRDICIHNICGSVCDSNASSCIITCILFPSSAGKHARWISSSIIRTRDNGNNQPNSHAGRKCSWWRYWPDKTSVAANSSSDFWGFKLWKDNAGRNPDTWSADNRCSSSCFPSIISVVTAASIRAECRISCCTSSSTGCAGKRCKSSDSSGLSTIYSASRRRRRRSITLPSTPRNNPNSHAGRSGNQYRPRPKLIRYCSK